MLLLAVVLYRARSSSAALDTSGTPRPDLTGTAGGDATGGATSAGATRPVIVDPLTGQVQTTDAGSDESPALLSFAYPTSSSDYSGPPQPDPTTPGAPGTALYDVARGTLAGSQTSSGTILIGQDAKGSTPAQRAAAQVAATTAAESYAKQVVGYYQGSHTAGL